MSKNFETPIQVKYRDTDSMGHVSSPVYYDYLQHAYLEFMFKVLSVPKHEKLPHIMVKTACEYVQPAMFGDSLVVRGRVSGFGTKSFEIEHIMHRQDGQDTVVARGYSKHVMFDYESNKTTPVTEDFKARILDFQGSV